MSTMKISNKSPDLLETGWKMVRIQDVEHEDRPHEKIKEKLIVKVNNKNIQKTLDGDLFPIDFPIWDRVNSDGSLGGEYDIQKLIRAAGIIDENIDKEEVTFDPINLKGKDIMVRFFKKPGDKYVSAYQGYVLPVDATESLIEKAEEDFQNYYQYLKDKHDKKLNRQNRRDEIISDNNGNYDVEKTLSKESSEPDEDLDNLPF